MLSNTEIIHSIPVDELTGAISVPIYQTSTFVQEAPGVNKGFDYARTGNPTRAALEKIVAELEGGSTGIAFSSGLAAIDAVIKLLKAGDEVVAVDDIYGGAYRLFNTVYNKFGIQIRFVDTTNAQNVFDAITEKTKLVWIESPTNPTLKISDIEAIAKIAHANNALLCVDNTFASPALQNPIRLGADIVIHSATKYLGGHSDLIAGIAVAKDPAVGAELKYIQNASGAILAPFDSWLVIRGIETLNLRLSKHCETAQYIAERLQQHPAIDKVYYPGLKDHPNHDIAKKQASGFGGIISFTLKDDTGEAAVKFITSTKLFKLAESLGGAKSLCCHPATMTHKSIPAEKRRSTGISDSLVRLSVGLEEATDLLRDIDTALVHSNKNELVIA
jgi:cysteine-S-conjugate beta-lyase